MVNWHTYQPSCNAFSNLLTPLQTSSEIMQTPARHADWRKGKTQICRFAKCTERERERRARAREKRLSRARKRDCVLWERDQFFRCCVDRSRLFAEGGREGGRERIGWRPDLKERYKARFAGRLIIRVLWWYICLTRSEKRQFGFDGIGAFLWHPFLCKESGAGTGGKWRRSGFDDYGWTVLFF